MQQVEGHEVSHSLHVILPNPGTLLTLSTPFLPVCGECFVRQGWTPSPGTYIFELFSARYGHRRSTGGRTRPQKSWLAYTDEHVEGEFWQYWEDMSRPIAALLSLLMALAYPVGTITHDHQPFWDGALHSKQRSKRSTPKMCLCMHAGLYNMVGNCRWSRGPCILAGAIQGACAVEHALIYRFLLLRGRAWRLRERTKAWILLGDMLACMLLMMLVRWVNLWASSAAQ